jgi:hypothetical protein
VVTGTFRDLFVAIAGAAGALTGLLFVALSVAPRPRMGQQPDVIRQVRAAAALLSFTNALAVSLFGLVPENHVGYPAAVMGTIGLMFTLAGLRSIMADPAGRARVLGQLGLIMLLLGVFGIELVSAIVLIVHPGNASAIEWLGNLLVACLIIGVYRAWELVGDRDTSIFSSIAALSGHERHLGGSVAGPADVPPDDVTGPATVSPTQVAGRGHAAGPAGPASPHGAASPRDAAAPGD